VEQTNVPIDDVPVGIKTGRELFLGFLPQLLVGRLDPASVERQVGPDVAAGSLPDAERTRNCAHTFVSHDVHPESAEEVR
jgi:hypothetical protein